MSPVLVGLLAQAASPISENVGLDRDQWFVLLIVGISCLTAVIISVAGIAAGIASSVHRRTNEANLKREMLDRGMSADEIEKVISTSTPENAYDRWATAWGKCRKR